MELFGTFSVMVPPGMIDRFVKCVTHCTASKRCYGRRHLLFVLPHAQNREGAFCVKYAQDLVSNLSSVVPSILILLSCVRQEIDDGNVLKSQGAAACKVEALAQRDKSGTAREGDVSTQVI